ncbi:MAG: choice-of-anchor tandem repeat GloVer-containing protein [Candidatus Korobacteraceae bacterium]
MTTRPRFTLHLPLLALAMLGVMTMLATAGQAQTFTVLHNFSNGPDGGQPAAGLSMDRAGNLYGTASTGGNSSGACAYPNPPGCGTVFKLSRKGSGWVLTTLYTFSGPDGRNPQTRVIIGPDGTLYGTTTYGGDLNEGTVFNLRPPATPCKSVLCPWTETVLHSFDGYGDGAEPTFGDPVFDAAGNIYGTTPYGGHGSNGTVYKLTHSNGGWTETVLYRFQGGTDGATPYGGLVFDEAGNLWGTTAYGGGYEDGTIYELAPSGGGWTESVVYHFLGGSDGANPYASLIVDQSGNFYGTTFGNNGITPKVYELSPSNGGWAFSVLYSLGADQGIVGKLAMDAAGNLYGTNFYDIPEVFQLTPSNGGWTLTGSWGGIGDNPFGNVIFDDSGNLYSTAYDGGPSEVGLVFEITP